MASRVAPRFILASGSPRRRQLLRDAGYEFEVVSPPVDEVSHGWLTIRELTIHNATRKALHVARISPDAVVLAADTLVTIDGDVLGKPADMQNAVAMLRRLSGRSHEVWTAVCICHAARGKSQSFHEISRVEFRPLTERAIQNYFAIINPLDMRARTRRKDTAKKSSNESEAPTATSSVCRWKRPRACSAPLASRLGALSRDNYSAFVALSRKQTSSLFPSGSSKKTA